MAELNPMPTQPLFLPVRVNVMFDSFCVHDTSTTPSCEVKVPSTHNPVFHDHNHSMRTSKDDANFSNITYQGIQDIKTRLNRTVGASALHVFVFFISINLSKVLNVSSHSNNNSTHLQKMSSNRNSSE
jgi:hypothetical protein